MLVWTISEILGVSVEGGHLLVFVDGLFFLEVGQCGCLRVFANITHQDVVVSEDNSYAFLQSWVFML